MASFARTIPMVEKRSYVDEILSRSNHFTPFQRCPRYADSGDFLYFVYEGAIVGRVRIDRIERTDRVVLLGSEKRPYSAKYLVHYVESWQRPERDIPLPGFHGIRYLDNIEGLGNLDQEKWKGAT